MLGLSSPNFEKGTSRAAPRRPPFELAAARVHHSPSRVRGGPPAREPALERARERAALRSLLARERPRPHLRPRGHARRRGEPEDGNADRPQAAEGGARARSREQVRPPQPERRPRFPARRDPDRRERRDRLL